MNTSINYSFSTLKLIFENSAVAFTNVLTYNKNEIRFVIDK